MCKIICVTNRHLCNVDFLLQIEEIAKSDIDYIILREKDLSESEYEKLAIKVIDICDKYKKTCILHSFINVAIRLNHDKIHLPLHILEENSNRLSSFSMIGASIHSVLEAKMAQQLGSTYITAGHIFATDCKKGLPPRGLEFCHSVCKSVDIKVFGIGGISSDNANIVLNSGADGVCIMSSFMTSLYPNDLLKQIRLSL